MLSLAYSKRLKFTLYVTSNCIAEMINIIVLCLIKTNQAPGMVFTKACPGPLLSLTLDKAELKAHPYGFLFTCLSAVLVKQYWPFSGFADTTEGDMLVIYLGILYLNYDCYKEQV